MIALIWKLQIVSTIVSDMVFTCVILWVWIFLYQSEATGSKPLFILVRAVVFDVAYFLCYETLDVSYLYSAIMTGIAFDSVLYRLLLPNSPLDKGLPVLETAVRRCFSK